MNAKPSRKSIGDPKGFRSLYVIEWYASEHDCWVPWFDGYESCSMSGAKEKLTWARQDSGIQFRIALYVRAEEERKP